MEVYVGGISAWMPFYWADFWYDTQHLNNRETVAYLRTMSAYWQSGEALPDKVFRMLCGSSFPVVADFYENRAGRWHHKRIDLELEKATKAYAIKYEKSMKGVAARRAKGQI